MRVLVTGGVRSGRSHRAEELLAHHPDVTYVRPRPLHDDPAWAARLGVLRHRHPRTTWSVTETGDLAEALWTPGPVLVDSVGAWLTRLLDDAGIWDARAEDVTAYVDEELDAALAALGGTDHDRVLITSEVGLGVVPEHRTGRLYRELLGEVNQRVAAVSDQVHLMVAGRVLLL